MWRAEVPSDSPARITTDMSGPTEMSITPVSDTATDWLTYSVDQDAGRSQLDVQLE